MTTPSEAASRRAAEEVFNKWWKDSDGAWTTLIDLVDAARARAVEGERAWWTTMTDELFPCVAAGRPKGSCEHEGWLECLLDAAALRAPAVTKDNAHFGDPCIYCGVPHDEVPVGPCKGRAPGETT